jgi:branched-chain amino acid transport system substrate-binding protein
MEAEMRLRTVLSQALVVSALGFAMTSVQAEGTLKIGLVAPFSGPFAAYGTQMYDGMKTYMSLNGDEVAGKKIEIIRRDTGGSGPASAKRLSQELVTRDKVDFLAGYGLTPEAQASGSVAEASKTPMIVMNAATTSIMDKSKYIARVSLTTLQGGDVMGRWAAQAGIKKVVTMVADYGPGIDAETAFKKTFTAGGGTILDSIRTPLNNPDFGPFMQRAHDLKPDAVFVFVPAGEQSISFMKNFREKGMSAAGVKVIGPGDVTDDHVLNTMGDEALGVITTHQYSQAHNSPENKKFLAAYAKVNPDAGPANFMTVSGYDGMDAIYQVAKKLNGVIDGDKAMTVLRGMHIDSPRGPITIDAKTRDIDQREYIRVVERVNGVLRNVEFEQYPNSKGEDKFECLIPELCKKLSAS